MYLDAAVSHIVDVNKLSVADVEVALKHLCQSTCRIKACKARYACCHSLAVKCCIVAYTLIPVSTCIYYIVEELVLNEIVDISAFGCIFHHLNVYAHLLNDIGCSAGSIECHTKVIEALGYTDNFRIVICLNREKHARLISAVR